MAADFITIDRNARHGSSTVGLANLVQQAQDLADNLDANANHLIDPGDYTALEAKFGLQAGAGANFASLLGSVKEALNAAILLEFVARAANQ